MNTPTPTVGALRAAKAILAFQYPMNTKTPNQLAQIIDSESGLAECIEAIKGAAHDLEEIRIAIHGLDGDPGEIKQLRNICEGRLLALEQTIKKLQNPNADVKQAYVRGRWT